MSTFPNGVSSLVAAPTLSTTAGVMSELADRVAELRQIVPLARPVIYLDYPVHTNIGDLLIEKGTERFLMQHAYQVAGRRSAYDFGARDRAWMPRDATLLLHGGGNFGDIYRLHQAFRLDVIAAFPDHRIVMMPQTLHFDSDLHMAECARQFSKHGDLHVCLRDARSYDMFRRHFRNPAYLIPDMAHALWADYQPAYSVSHGARRLYFARTDVEHRNLPGAAGERPIDWWDLLNASDKLIYEIFARLHVGHGRIDVPRSLHPAWRLYRNRLIVKAQRLLDDYDSVVTNRLHMALFALMLGRKVVMADNSYGKLSCYYDTWLAECPDLEFVIS